MFDSGCLTSTRAFLAAVEANERLSVEQSCRRLVLAAQWADLHPGATADSDGRPGRDTSWRPGGEGTPSVSGFAMAELGCALAGTAASAAKLVADALDLRHRRSLIWRRVLAADVPGHLAAGLPKPPDPCLRRPPPGWMPNGPVS